MRWKQFFTPVKSINAIQAGELIQKASPGEINILDVRQPTEYEKGHIPGAKLIPLPELGDRLQELDSDRETLVY